MESWIATGIEDADIEIPRVVPSGWSYL